MRLIEGIFEKAGDSEARQLMREVREIRKRINSGGSAPRFVKVGTRLVARARFGNRQALLKSECK